MFVSRMSILGMLSHWLIGQTYDSPSPPLYIHTPTHIGTFTGVCPFADGFWIYPWKAHIKLFRIIRTLGNSLAVQWFGFQASTAGGMGLLLVRELRSHMLCSTAKKPQNIKYSWLDFKYIVFFKIVLKRIIFCLPSFQSHQCRTSRPECSQVYSDDFFFFACQAFQNQG